MGNVFKIQGPGFVFFQIVFHRIIIILIIFWGRSPVAGNFFRNKFSKGINVIEMNIYLNITPFCDSIIYADTKV